MSSLGYITKRTFCNKLKRALKKPVTYIVAIFIIFYAVMVIFGISNLAKDFHFDSEQGVATVMSLLMFYIVPADIISYIKRKGIVFVPSEVHFVFPAPENPKHVILRAGFRQFIVQFVVGLVFLLIGVCGCGIPLTKMLLFFGYFVIMEMLMEGALMIVCYGNEILPSLFFDVMKWIFYTMMVALVVGLAVFGYINDFGQGSVGAFLNLPFVQMIPILGWEVAIIHLIMVGPTVINVIASVLLIAFTVAMVICAVKMPCTGEFYEDAANYASDYDKMRKKANKGEVVVGTVGKKKKRFVRNVRANYKGNCAKAIYYRQLLEYKKKRFFIFGANSLISLVIGLFIGILGVTEKIPLDLDAKMFIIPGIMAYLMFFFSAYATKWARELENPYTYLIPDGSVKKVWYSTKVEHIRAIVDGTLMTLPAAIGMKLNPVMAVLTVLFYVSLNANKLYIGMLANTIIGQTLGETGKSLVRILIQCIIIVFTVVAAVLGFAISEIAGFSLMIFVVLLFAIAGAVGASFSFDRMESFN